MSHKTTAARRRENMSLELPQAVDYFCTSMTLEGGRHVAFPHLKSLPKAIRFLTNKAYPAEFGVSCKKVSEITGAHAPHDAARRIRLKREPAERGCRVSPGGVLRLSVVRSSRVV